MRYRWHHVSPVIFAIACEVDLPAVNQCVQAHECEANHVCEGGRCIPVSEGDTSRPDSTTDTTDAEPCEPEVCDGLDNDCDDQIDEDDRGEPLAYPCYDGTNDTQDVGECRAGVQTCEQGRRGGCVGQIHPAVEICDGLDNDCNGETDETFGVGEICFVGMGACAREGQFVCNPIDDRSTVCDAVSGPPGDIDDCNNVDDDCDGEIDEDFVTDNTCGTGWCRAQNTPSACVNGHVTPCESGQARDELCNGIDDDCNGSTDDELVGPPADMQDGVCADSQRACMGADGWQEPSYRAIDDYEAEETLCDGLDNDCDGLTDEGHPVGDNCWLGVGACAAQGTLVCNPGQNGTVCSAQPGLSNTEICDGLDNDCDGETDEDDAGQPLIGVCYDGPDGTVDVGVCRAGIGTCSDGGLGECLGQVRPSPEICDGLDNDCDGTVDDDYPVGEVCTEGIGWCVQFGARVCSDTQDGTRCDAQAREPQEAETCNGIDDDCNGDIDEDELGQPLTRTCYSGPEGTRDVGPCRVGAQLCLGGIFGDCFDEILPTPESCDGVDNDCDGDIDEEYDVGAPCRVGMGACEGRGVRVCNEEGNGTVCNATLGEPALEICNGIDDDCDGIPDDDFNVNEPCVAGHGPCGRQGLFVCNDAQDGTVCSATPGDPLSGIDAVCNGVDDDCDGETDEDYTADRACCNVGRCRMSCTPSTCIGGVEAACVPGESAAEICNGIDDDCDGETDEDLEPVPPADRQLGVCHESRQICAGADNWVEPDYNQRDGYEVVENTCDGRDNDCDGEIDEDTGGGSCDTGQVGICAAGTEMCEGGEIVCVPDQNEHEVVELCGADRLGDGLDNDCDGEIDECCNGEWTEVPDGWACIPPGEFWMGSPIDEPGRAQDEGRHRVEIARPFLLQTTEVTRQVWRDVMGSNPRNIDECGDDCPVGKVRWWAAAAYCNVLSVQHDPPLDECYTLHDCSRRPGDGMNCGEQVDFLGLGCSGYRLPTEAEWEYAARAGTQEATYNHDEPWTIVGARNAPNLDSIAWYAGNSGAEYVDAVDCSGWDERQYPDAELCGVHPVGLKRPNPWGLYDMLGNVQEFTWDWYAGDYGGFGDPTVLIRNPTGSATLTRPSNVHGVVVKGGRFQGIAGDCRSAARTSVRLLDEDNNLGFRVARSLRLLGDEICDGFDNNLDGQIDEGNPEADGECNTGQPGVCAAGIEICQDGELVCEPIEPRAEEMCGDGIDNDCDGDIDERCNGCPLGILVPEGWACVPPGEFYMGSPVGQAGRGSDEDLHRVAITRPFLVKITEVTRKEWRDVVHTETRVRDRCGDNCPVGWVTWWEAATYCNMLSLQEGLEECYTLHDCNAVPGDNMVCGERLDFEGLGCSGYRLPTEAEWEYAARAGTVGATYNQDSPWVLVGHMDSHNAPNLDPIAWYSGNSGVEDDSATDCSDWPERQYSDTQFCGVHPVGLKDPNAWGLYDMLGNVLEWTWDWYVAYLAEEVGDPHLPVRDPVGAFTLTRPADVSDSTARGGAYDMYARSCRSAERHRLRLFDRGPNLGFRPVRSLGRTPETCDGLDNNANGRIDEGCNGCPEGTVVPHDWACVPATGPGGFWMGSPEDEPDREVARETQHLVAITRPFLVKATEVTQAEWRRVMGVNPSAFSECGDDCPVDSVNWYHAVTYANALSIDQGLEPCYLDPSDGTHYEADDPPKIPVWADGLSCTGYRLPTEAEWEYAARAGTEGPCYNEDVLWEVNGACAQALDPIAWYPCNADERTHPVARKVANAWGLFDVLGNVSEWTWDRYADDYGGFGDADEPVLDPIGSDDAEGRAGRGRGYGQAAEDDRVAFRVGYHPGMVNQGVGLRLVRSLAP